MTSTVERPRTVQPVLRFEEVRGGLPAAVLAWPSVPPTLAAQIGMFAALGLEVAGMADAEDAGAGAGERAGAGAHRFVFAPPPFPWTARTAALLEQAFAACAGGATETDAYTGLVGAAQVGWREVVLVRAACRYLRQVGLALPDTSIVALLVGQRGFVRAWLDAFAARFDPDRATPAAASADAASADPADAVAQAVAAARTLDEDRLLRALASFLDAVVRTNWYRDPAAVAFKLDPSRLSVTAPLTPYREIFVHSPTVEGSHVRGGPIARGGLRCSDRKDDFRTEVLGLLKTQVVKNSLIVPVGAKGAFVARGGACARDAYREFVGALLEVTDTVVDGRAAHPDHTVVHDGPDPYLVVAADKGTATFSDLANTVAAERGFWLGDAFASGGSAGYDHKAMGITARGAWCSVRRHLAELGVDVDTDPFTVVGVGDMSGDVFGNGMLLSGAIRLVAAFDHRHIFLDPAPDEAASHAERARLAALPRSSWDDYDRALISDGGGVWPRTAKAVPLSPQVRQLLGTDARQLPPHELIRALLSAPVDLLWNGGIGTYVKASDEPHSAAADPANDAVRVDASALRCRAVGEGGNLGFTQRARVEYALAGGKVNADFIDNAAGVATSDREVNLKIALAGRLPRPERDALLASVTDEVAAAVLADADRQTLAISLAEAHAPFLISRHERLIENLEAAAGIDRHAEGLPSDTELAARHRAGTGLVRPEIATLLAQSKNLVRRELLASGELGDPVFAPVLEGYFPEAVRPYVTAHPLAREIVAVTVAGEVINRVGPGFIRRLEEQLGVGSAAIAKAYWVVREVFDLDGLWGQVLALDVPARTQVALLAGVQAMVETATAQLLRHGAGVAPARLVERYRPAVRRLRADLPRLTGVVDRDLAALRLLAHGLALADTASHTGRPISEAAQVFQEVGRATGLDLLVVDGAAAAGDHWDALARAILTDDVHDRWHAVARKVLRGGGAADAPAGWAGAGRVRAAVEEVRASGQVSAAQLCVVAAALR